MGFGQSRCSQFNIYFLKGSFESVAAEDVSSGGRVSVHEQSFFSGVAADFSARRFFREALFRF